MSCEEMLPLLHGHLDGANSAAEEAQLQAHLHTCPACRSLLHQYEQMDAQVQQLEVEAPEQLAAGVMYKIGLEKRGKRKRFAFGRGTVWAAAAVLVLVVGSGSLRLGNVGDDTSSANLQQNTRVQMQSRDELQPETDATADLAESQSLPESGSPEMAALDSAETDGGIMLTAGPAVTVKGDGQAWDAKLLQLLQPYETEPDSGRYLVPQEVAQEVLDQFGDRYEIQSGALEPEENLLVLNP